MNAAIVCDGKELETYDVKQEGTSSLTGFIASEAGKVRAFFSLRLTHYEPPRNHFLFWVKQFKITVSNNLTNFAVNVVLFIDGQRAEAQVVRARASLDFLGVHQSSHSVLRFKFQELRLVGTSTFSLFE